MSTEQSIINSKLFRIEQLISASKRNAEKQILKEQTEIKTLSRILENLKTTNDKLRKDRYEKVVDHIRSKRSHSNHSKSEVSKNLDFLKTGETLNTNPVMKTLNKKKLKRGLSMFENAVHF